MAHHITAAESNDTPAGDAFAFTAATPDSLTVDDGAFLISRSAGSGASLEGAWTVFIGGAVEAFGAGSDGLQCFAGSPGDASSIVVGRNGDIFGIDHGIVVGQTLKLVNLGTISGAESISAIGQTTLINAGMLIGDVRFGSGNDSFTNFKKIGNVIKHGVVVGLIDPGDGNDSFKGGKFAETFRDSPGADTASLGAGADTYRAVKQLVNPDGVDIINGGSGIDTYDASSASAAVAINLDKISHGFLLGPLSAVGSDVGGDQIIAFENARGGSAGDSIFGSSGRNALDGRAGADHLFGLRGADILTGGTNADTFHFLKLTDSGTKGATRDLITDFSGTGAGEGDKIDLSAITIGGNPAFDSFIGTDQFGKNPGEVRQSFTGGFTIISGDVNGDGKADFSIALAGHLFLQGTDFTFV